LPPGNVLEHLYLELWIPITILAAFSQNVRSVLQKHLTLNLSTVGATHARFFYAAPFAVAYVAALHYGMGYELPEFNAAFFTYVVVGATVQVIATVLLVLLFSHRNFFVGAAFSKTEAIQVAVFGFVLLSDQISLGAIVGICIGIAGVIAISAAMSRPGMASVLGSLTSRASVIGLLVGLLFGLAATCFRGASLSLSGGFAIQAAVTLAFALVLQAIVVSAYLWKREPGQMTALWIHWRVASLVGLAGMIASAGWFSAMTLQNAAYVKAVGQIELVFAFAASALVFREKTTRAEFLGVALIVIGIFVVLRYR
jgi:drug/metabolite transporter (DMT)-like permease